MSTSNTIPWETKLSPSTSSTTYHNYLEHIIIININQFAFRKALYHHLHSSNHDCPYPRSSNIWEITMPTHPDHCHHPAMKTSSLKYTTHQPKDWLLTINYMALYTSCMEIQPKMTLLQSFIKWHQWLYGPNFYIVTHSQTIIWLVCIITWLYWSILHE